MKKIRFSQYLPQINILQGRGFLTDIDNISNPNGYYEIDKGVNPLSNTGLPFSYGFLIHYRSVMNGYIFIKQSATNFEGTLIRERIFWKDSWKPWQVIK